VWIGDDWGLSARGSALLRFLLVKKVDGKQETREVVETKSGSLDRLIAIAGRPLSADQQRAETERILRLSHNPEEQRKIERTRKKDAEQCAAFFKMVHEAFLLEYAGESGNVVKLNFKPNPAFRPPSRKGKVLHDGGRGLGGPQAAALGQHNRPPYKLNLS
jgi:hypothetical protein